ncbi:MAG: Uma2 family endonuclease [Anaerolineae bacterium]|nr:Uma2 family endonuclease [Anaerolineae bacterium]
MNAVIALPETKLITGEELFAMGDIGPCELIDGRIVLMTPAGGEHGLVEFNLGSELRSFVRQHTLGWVMGGEVGVYTRRNPDRVRGADVVFISKERLPDRPQGFLEVAPELIVEIISPTDRWQDMHEKLEEYFAIGVQQVWIVEPPTRTVRVYHSATEMYKLTESDILAGEGPLAGFALAVAEIFAA